MTQKAAQRLDKVRIDTPLPDDATCDTISQTVPPSFFFNACLGPDLPPRAERDLELRSRGVRGQRTWNPAPPKHRATQQQLRGLVSEDDADDDAKE